MNKDCSELKRILEDLIDEIDHVKTIWQGIRELNPSFEQMSEDSWRKKMACLWIHGATKPIEANELERWLFVYPSLSCTAKSEAGDHYLKWSKHIFEDGVYADFAETDLLKPEKEELLFEYIVRLAQTLEHVGWGTKKNERALKSFLHFLRRYDQEEVAFIEHIFPQKMDLHYGQIIRKVPPQVRPISQKVAALIIKELAYECAYGRPDARHHAGEALALIWMCLSAARIRWRRSLESVHAIESNAFIFIEENPQLLVPSFFGPYGVRIGKLVTRFLQAVANIHSDIPRKTILQTALPDLRKPLNKAIKKIDLPPHIGKITFVTFLSPPHYNDANIR